MTSPGPVSWALSMSEGQREREPNWVHLIMRLAQDDAYCFQRAMSVSSMPKNRSGGGVVVEGKGASIWHTLSFLSLDFFRFLTMPRGGGQAPMGWGKDFYGTMGGSM